MGGTFRSPQNAGVNDRDTGSEEMFFHSYWD
jgi:hypothetical protein